MITPGVADLKDADAIPTTVVGQRPDAGLTSGTGPPEPHHALRWVGVLGDDRSLRDRGDHGLGVGAVVLMWAEVSVRLAAGRGCGPVREPR